MVPEILVASDSASLHAEIRAVLADATTTVRWVRSGPEVRIALSAAPADLAVVDLQIGTMGGIAVALDLRLEVDAGRLEACPVLLLLDRRPDVFLARRVGVEGWIIKPLDAIRIRRAVTALLGGGTWFDESYRPEPVAVAPAR